MENKKSYPEWKLSKVKHTILEGYVTEHIFEKQFLKLTPEKFTSGWWSAIINDQRFFFLVSKTLNDVDRRVVEILSQKYPCWRVYYDKVIAICRDETESIDLLRKTTLSVLSEDMIAEMFSGFKNDEANQFNLPELKTKIKGPAVIVIPVAIYA